MKTSRIMRKQDQTISHMHQPQTPSILKKLKKAKNKKRKRKSLYLLRNLTKLNPIKNMEQEEYL
jgi:hypothetical protein